MLKDYLQIHNISFSMTFKLIQTTTNLVSKNAIHFSFQRNREETRIDVRRVHEINSLSSPNYILHHRRASPRITSALEKS